MKKMIHPIEKYRSENNEECMKATKMAIRKYNTRRWTVLYTVLYRTYLRVAIRKSQIDPRIDLVSIR